MSEPSACSAARGRCHSRASKQLAPGNKAAFEGRTGGATDEPQRLFGLMVGLMRNLAA